MPVGPCAVGVTTLTSQRRHASRPAVDVRRLRPSRPRWSSGVAVDVGVELLADQRSETLDRMRGLDRRVGVQLDDLDFLDGRGAAGTVGEFAVRLRNRAEDGPDGIPDGDVRRRGAPDQQHRQAQRLRGLAHHPRDAARPSRRSSTY